MSRAAQQAIQGAVAQWMERADIEEMARMLRERENGIMPAKDREKLEKELGIYRFGKWALLGDGESNQQIKRQLDYQARIKESMTFYQSVVPLNDEEGVAYDAVITAVLNKQERNVVTCVYQYFRSEEAAARILNIDRHTLRVVRDGALRILNEALEKKIDLPPVRRHNLR